MGTRNSPAFQWGLSALKPGYVQDMGSVVSFFLNIALHTPIIQHRLQNRWQFVARSVPKSSTALLTFPILYHLVSPTRPHSTCLLDIAQLPSHKMPRMYSVHTPCTQHIRSISGRVAIHRYHTAPRTHQALAVRSTPSIGNVGRMGLIT